MEIAQEILGLVAQGLAFLFILWMMINLVLSQKKDGKFTADEASKVSVICTFMFMIIVNAYSTKPPFDTTMILLALGSVLGLAGISITKVKKNIK